MDRREFLGITRQRENRELSGEELYMRYVNAKLEGRAESFLEYLEAELAETPFRILGSHWLAGTELETLIDQASGPSRRRQQRHTVCERTRSRAS